MERLETQFEIADAIATITLNRPDKLNAWTETMEREVRSAFQEAEQDERVRAIILTGAGRGFCAGADMSLLKDLAEHGVASLRPPEQMVKRVGARPDFQHKYSYFPALSKPVIAAINGPVVGLGLVLSLYCDMRFAADSAKFSTTFARRGLIAEYGIAWMLPRIVGLPNALDLLFSARTINAAEALRIGLVNQVFPADTLAAKVREYVRELVTFSSPRSMRIMKQQIYDGLFQTLAEASDVAEREILASLECEDFKEGVAHFREKRTPQFTGR
jgi:enoyl-CoA hydratase/carnithine racemase